MSRLLSAWVTLIVFICELFLWAFHAFLAKHFILLMFSIFCHVQTAHHPQDKSLYYISSSPYFNHSLILYLFFSRAVLLSKTQVLKIASPVLQSYISQNIHPLFSPSFFSNLSKNATLYKCVLSFSEWTQYSSDFHAQFHCQSPLSGIPEKLWKTLVASECAVIRNRTTFNYLLLLLHPLLSGKK